MNEPWAIEPAKFRMISDAVDLVLLMEGAARADYIATVRAGLEPLRAADDARHGDAPVRGGIAVVPLRGTLLARAGGMDAASGGQSLEAFRDQMRGAANDPAIESIVIDVDSPGGAVDMVQETAAFVRELRETTPITAVANTLAASAAFWIAAQASELVITPSGQVGAVGIVARHENRAAALEAQGVDVTLLSTARFKLEGNDTEELGGEARDVRLEQMQTFHGQFVDDLAKGRGLPRARVNRDFGEGRMVLAADAVERGMADRVATLDAVLSGLGARGRSRPRRGATATNDELVAAGLGQLIGASDG